MLRSIESYHQLKYPCTSVPVTLCAHSKCIHMVVADFIDMHATQRPYFSLCVYVPLTTLPRSCMCQSTLPCPAHVFQSMLPCPANMPMKPLLCHAHVPINVLMLPCPVHVPQLPAQLVHQPAQPHTRGRVLCLPDGGPPGLVPLHWPVHILGPGLLPHPLPTDPAGGSQAHAGGLKAWQHVKWMEQEDVWWVGSEALLGANNTYPSM